MKFLDENRTSELWQAVKNKVNSLVLSITTAQQTANNAIEAAETAQSSANTAQEAADNAQSTADAAKATAEAALPLSGGVMTGQITGITTPVVDTGATNKLYVDSSIIRPNLLDNAYFINPVNQRGQTVYQGGLNVMQYTIDRWRSENSTVTVEDDGLKIYGEATYGLIRQFYENAKELSEKTLTVSVLYPGTTVPVGSYITCIDSKEEFWQGRITDANLQYITFTVNDNITSFSTILVTSNEAYKTIKPIAAKLEIGNTQTLAHEENGVWVLNEIPDYATELLKCKRYFQNFIGGWNAPVKGIGNVQAWGKYLYYRFFYPVSFRVPPAITISQIYDVEAQSTIAFSSQPTLNGNADGLNALYWENSAAPAIENNKEYAVSFSLSADL